MDSGSWILDLAWHLAILMSRVLRAIARGEMHTIRTREPAGSHRLARQPIGQACRPPQPLVAEHFTLRGRHLLPPPCFQKPPRCCRHLGCSIPRRSRAVCCCRRAPLGTLLGPPPQTQLPTSSCRRLSWRASAPERPSRLPSQAFWHMVGRP